MFAALYGYDSIVSLLLRKPLIEIGVIDQRGRTALIYACLKGHGYIVAKLIKAGQVDLNRRDQSGKNSLGFAVNYGYRQIVEVLLHEKEWNIHDTGDSEEFDSILDLAKFSGQFFISLLQQDCGCVKCREQ